jgi:hypothetical protein
MMQWAVENMEKLHYIFIGAVLMGCILVVGSRK